jgi:hypothetical protein
MLCKVSSLSSLKPLSHFNGWSQFNLSSKARIFFGIIGIFAGTYACSSSALAEVEEDTNQEVNKPGYSASTLSNNIITNLFIDNYTDEDVARYLLNLDRSHNNAESVDRDVEKYTGSHPAFSSSTNPHGFDDAHIPETVWSLDASTGAHLDHISGGPGSDIYAVFGGSPTVNDFWIRASFGLWADNNTSGASVLLGTSSKFQVASCGGSSAEHGGLDYCDDAKLAANQLSDQSSKLEQSGSGTATQGASNNVPSSNGAPASNLTDQLIAAPLTPAIADQSLLQGTLSVLGPCDVSASCASVVINPLETPVDAPALDPPPLIGDLTYPDPPAPSPIVSIVYVDDPGPVSDLAPVFTPQPLRPIPEASTWVMTVIGFGIMAFLFGKKRRPRINPISIVDVSE